MKNNFRSLLLLASLSVCHPPAHAWKVEKDGVIQLKLTNDGKLGVGAGIPSSALDVDGVDATVEIRDRTTVFTQSSEPVSRLKLSSRQNVDGTSAPYAGAALEFQLDWNGTLANAARIVGRGHRSWGGTLDFDIAEGGGALSDYVTRMRILKNGNVGIGTVSPSYPLTVNGRIQTNSSVQVTAGGELILNDQADTSWMSLKNDANNILITSVAGEKVRITSGGKVGIRTASPREALDVNGLLVGGFGAHTTGGVRDWNDITNARSGSGYTLLLGTDANGPGGSYYHPFSFEYNGKNGVSNMTQFAIPYHSTGQNVGLFFRTRYSNVWQGWSKILSENLSGDVGIGTTSPGSVGGNNIPGKSLQIAGDSSTRGNLIISGNGSRIDLEDTQGSSGSRVSSLYQGVDYLRIGPSTDTGALDVEKGITIDNSTGNVGIGTTTPGAKLDVAGHIWQTGTGSSVFIGEGAGANDDLSTNKNTFVGNLAGNTNTTGNHNAAYGYRSLENNTTGFNNTAQGVYSLNNNTAGSYNSAQGGYSLSSNTTGNFNTAQGVYSLYSNTTGTYNTAVGYKSLYANSTGSYNAALGYGSLDSNTTGYSNTASGYNALFSNTTGYRNSAFGTNTLTYNIGGLANSAYGVTALHRNTSGSQNVASGYASLYSNTTGSENVALGNYAGFDQTTASWNSFIGYNTGRGITTGGNNTIIGARVSGLSNTLANNIIIADGAGNRRINVDASGNVGIGTTTPAQKLDVNGNIAVAGSTVHTSDQRLKKNIQTLENSLGKISELRGVSFEWKEDEDRSKGEQIGVIAQEVEAQFPQLIVEGNDGMKAVNYAGLIGPLIEAVKTLKAENKALRDRLDKAGL